jgi:hypothetical protein
MTGVLRAWGNRRAVSAGSIPLIVALALASCRTAPAPVLVPALEPALAPMTRPAPVPEPPPSAPVMPSTLLLAEADGLLSERNYEDAVHAYDDFLRQFPEEAAASRVRATRDVLSSLVETNAEVARLREQTQVAERDLVRLRRDLSLRQTELGRLRQELADRQAELARLTAESDSLRLDLERLKSVDLRLERPR